MTITRADTFIFVCNIRTPYYDAGNLKESSGTGIFIQKESKHYLLTAQHISKMSSKDAYIYLCDNQQKPYKIMISQLNSNLIWKEHPVADMAVLEIDVSSNPWITTRSFPYTQCDISLSSLNRDVELTTVGFPLSLGIKDKFAPLTFRSHAASDILKIFRFDTKTPTDAFFLENPSIGGYSGGPIFDLAYMVSGLMTQNLGDSKLLGIMHGVAETMACVTPVSYIQDLI